MSNQITSRRAPGADSLEMSNGLTAVFLDVLVLAGTDRATSEWEQKLVYWLAQHDQERTGAGVVGFDVADLGWSPEGFETQRRFVVAMIDDALARRGWERLPFRPEEDRLFAALRRFRSLVEGFAPGAVAQDGMDATDTWLPDELPTHGSCETHRVFLHETGCILCNDTPLGEPPAAAPNRSGLR